MKNLINILILSIFVINLNAQDTIQTKKVFVRIFNNSGVKIAKGKIHSLTNDAIHLSKGDKTSTVSLKNVGYIKTKRSGGHNVLMGAGAGAAIGIVVGVSTSDPDAWFGYTAAEGATGVGLAMGTVGAVVGGITVLFKKQKTFEINGDPKQWASFKMAMSGED